MDTPLYSNQYVWQKLLVNMVHSLVRPCPTRVLYQYGRECHNNLVVGLCYPYTVYPGSPVVSVSVCGDARMATNFFNDPCHSRTEEAGWRHNVDGYPMRS